VKLSVTISYDTEIHKAKNKDSQSSTVKKFNLFNLTARTARFFR
jgi:hypothetical protein